ncbi:ATP-binding protein [Aliidiomarina soli]|uniref:histidine kinase n=1 Tax=Aliidiomarina soli TaxID=1928574 RepID=A0A432WI24_9GAMM|nr:ATP-binding protein [Aliidiomarina soli]RUO33371.1 hypothetical protein CWE14_09165 [Aliidiomarina soli]
MLATLKPRSLGVKILGWFWLTLLLSYLAASVPTFFLPASVTERVIPAEDLTGMQALGQLIVKNVVENTDTELNKRDDRFVHWAVLSSDGSLMMSTESVPTQAQRLIEQAERDSQPVELLLRDMVISGPQYVELESEQYMLMFWRDRYPRFLDKIREIPGWLKLALVMLTTLGMSFLFYRSIVCPLQRLSRGFNELSQGNFDYRLGNEICLDDEFDKLYANFDRMASQLQEMVSMHNRLIADISHELKTPLSRLQMSVALARTAPPEQLGAYFDRAESEGEKLDEMIKQLLQLAECITRSLEFTCQQEEVPALLEPLLDDAQFEADALNVEFSVQAPDNISLLLHKRLFTMALENLIRNAFKYAQRLVSLRVYFKHDHCVFEVCDDGPGVNADDLPRLRTPFYRADQARSRQTGGVGLGLSIAHEAMVVHGGRLGLRNRQRGGFSASLHIPLR